MSNKSFTETKRIVPSLFFGLSFPHKKKYKKKKTEKERKRKDKKKYIYG